MHNGRVPIARSRRALAIGIALLAVAGCSANGSDTPLATGQSESPSASSGSPSASSTSRLTPQGTELSFGATASVPWAPTSITATTLKIKVSGARRASKKDFAGFMLDSAYKRQATYYYVDVTVTNTGSADVGGEGVPVWGVDAANTLLPAVSFTSPFRPCPSRPLPSRFPGGATKRSCLVFLAPHHGSLEAVSYRPTQQFDPITWTGKVQPPKPTVTKKHKKK